LDVAFARPDATARTNALIVEDVRNLGACVLTRFDVAGVGATVPESTTDICIPLYLASNQIHNDALLRTDGNISDKFMRLNNERHVPERTGCYCMLIVLDGPRCTCFFDIVRTRPLFLGSDMSLFIKKLLASAFLLSGLLVLHASYAASTLDMRGKTVVLVHGAFADGSSWQKVIPLLEARGLHVVAVQNPLSSLAADIAATKRVIDQQTGSVILVGHSWAGVVISDAGNDAKVSNLVYVAAFAPDSGQSIGDMTKGMGAPAWANELRKDSAGSLTLSKKAVLEDFAPDVPLTERRVIAATQVPWSAGCLAEKVSKAAWHDKPSYFLIADNDRMIDPSLQQTMAATIGAHVTRVKSSHVAMVSQPKAVADVIIAAAAAAK
jgi:pimeloyl-ACP methyl ester carboxylesterase